MRYICLLVGICAYQLSSAQLIVKPLSDAQANKSEKTRQADINFNTLPFWDDFSISSKSADGIRIWGNDTTFQWNTEESRHVLINATLAKNPPSYRVATFDGLTADGQFHGTEKGLTDQLQSDTLDLSGYLESDEIYLSFYWQAGGNVEMPDPGDSLILQFSNPTAATGWETIWLKDGEDVQYDSLFYQEAFKLEQRFLRDDFLFRFQSYGDQDGPFDAWHVDWIYINAGRDNEDFFYLDRGFTGQLTSPLSPFKALPINQYKANPIELTSVQTVQAFNLDRFIQPTEYIVVIRDLVNGIRIDSIQYGAKNPLSPNTDPQVISEYRMIDFEGIDLSSLPDGDSIVLQSELYIESSDDDFLDGTPIDLRINDTLRANYLLHDYYAFDDGSAEYAVGTNIRGGQVGVEFWLEEQDTLTHIDIYFPNIDPSSSGNSITIRIYKRLGDEFAMRTQPIEIVTAPDVDIFSRYVLNRPLIVSDTFYITYEQNVNEYIGIGFDRSNTAASEHIWEFNEGWIRNDRLQGALMIRPVFKPVPDYTLGTQESEPLTVYPNPVSDILRIKGTYEMIQIHNLSGQLMLEQAYSDDHDLSSLSSGLYLLSIFQKDGKQTQKIIKE